MWGTSLPEDKLAGNLGNVSEATSIGDRRSDFFAAGKLTPGSLGLFQQHRPRTDVDRFEIPQRSTSRCDIVPRRELIAALGCTAAWPVAARAQQPERVRRIGVLTPLAADDPESMARIAAFLQGLGELGWAVGRNVRIDYRWSAGDPDRIRKDATELVALAPDVILATGTPV